VSEGKLIEEKASLAEFYGLHKGELPTPLTGLPLGVISCLASLLSYIQGLNPEDEEAARSSAGNRITSGLLSALESPEDFKRRPIIRVRIRIRIRVRLNLRYMYFHSRRLLTLLRLLRLLL